MASGAFAAMSSVDTMATTISQQVEQMILQAKKDSENRVRHELNAARSQLQHMDSVIIQLTERVERSARSRSGLGASEERQTVDQAFLRDQISALEQKWAHETKALKQDLHRTILAHNHNSDLMRHHRDALDEACRRLDAHLPREAERISQQLVHLDHLLRQSQAKSQAIDVLTEHLTALEAQVRAILPESSGAAAGPSFAPMAPGLLAGQPATVKASAPVADDGKFNAEAPVFVPRSQPQDADAGAGAAADKESAGSAEPAAAPADPAPAEEGK